jgi:protease II
MEKIILDYIKNRNKKTKKLSDSLAKLEEELFEAERSGNKRKSESIKKIIKRLKK